MDYRMGREPLTAGFLAEAMPLLEAHWSEVAHYPDIPLDVDVGAYVYAYEAGNVRLFTVRDDSERLIGYASFFVRLNLHYSGSLQAVQDVLYLEPDARGGLGGRFIEWCDDQLRLEGVQVVYQHVKAKASLDFSPLLERMGYELVDKIYAKRLDAEVWDEIAPGVLSIVSNPYDTGLVA